MTGTITPVQLNSARVLICNDDGIEARGLQVLEKVARSVARDVWVSAPAEGHSGASAMVSLRREVTIRNSGDQRFAVTGRPADSLLAALRIIMADSPPDLVLSGVNHGLNIGGDLIYSGTVCVAMVAALNGVPAIAISAGHPEGENVVEETWKEVAQYLPDIIGKICALGFAHKGAYGVNFPIHVTDPTPVPCCQGDVGDSMYFSTIDARAGRYILDHAGGVEGKLDGADLGAIRTGRIGITPLTLDRTDHAVLDLLRAKG